MNQNQIESKPEDVEEPRDEGLDETTCSPSSDTPETDFVTGDLSISWYRKAGDLAFLVRKLERERNEWKQHAWRESDMREKLQSRIMDLVATDHESKEEFIQRVRGILLENVPVVAPPTLDSGLPDDAPGG